jgi:hypothetical protein
MVVAMASFLFVGCLPGVTPDVDDEEEEEEVVVVTTTVAPIITSVTDNAAVPAVIISLTATTVYMNAAEIALGIIVNGTAPTYSEVKVYIDDVCAGTANVGDTGAFSVVVAKADLGSDGEDKVLYATAKEAALPVSAHSVEYAFILDTVKPKALTLTATADTAAVATVDSAIVSGAALFDSATITGLGTLTTGTWTITCVADSAVANNVVISDGTTSTSYSVESDGATLVEFDGVIPGVRVFFGALTVGAVNTVTIVATDQIVDRATIVYSEAVTTASATAAANFTWWNTSTGAALADTIVTYKNLTTYFSPFVAVLAQYNLIGCAVNGLVDSAGNIQTTASAVTCTVGAASATSLAP